MRKIKRLMAYIYMPLIFAIIGYGLVYIMLNPFIEMGLALSTMVVAQDKPEFTTELTSIFNPQKTPSPELAVTDTTDDSANDEAEETTEVLENTVDIAEVVIPDFGTHYAQISCEKINLSVPVYYGDSNEILRNGVGQYSGSFMPGFGRTIMMAAHNTTFFLPLKDIQVGDILVIQTNYGIYEYEVTEMKVAKYNDSSAYDLAQKEKEELVLYTCYPFDQFTGAKQDRYFVYADKVSGPVITGGW